MSNVTNETIETSAATPALGLYAAFGEASADVLGTAPEIAPFAPSLGSNVRTHFELREAGSVKDGDYAQWLNVVHEAVDESNFEVYDEGYAAPETGDKSYMRFNMIRTVDGVLTYPWMQGEHASGKIGRASCRERV